jgi:hypothetical protein
MSLRIPLCLLAIALLASASARAQTPVRTEAIKPPAGSPSAPPQAAPAPPKPAAATPSKPTGHLAALAGAPEVITDLARLPGAVARTRERILAAARSGDLQRLAGLMQANETVFSFSDDKDPVAFWKTSYPDSDGLEVLAILISVLETGFVRVDEGTRQEMYVWPYFVRLPIKTLSPPQKVELFRILTGGDYKDLVKFGAYAFYRVGIGPQGTWHFFVAGD